MANLGFAKGNNVGFSVAKEYGAQFICVMNSDTYLLDDTFIEQVLLDYEHYSFFVLGPNIFTPNKKDQPNPMGRHLITKKEAFTKITSLKIQIVLAYLNLWNIFRKMCKTSSSKSPREQYGRDTYYEDVKLHGCCWIFSPEYIKRYDGINSQTFLYLEEDLLYIEMMKNQHKMIYSPNVRIFHLEDASMDSMSKGKSKRIFILKNHLKSMKVIYRRLNELE